MRVRLACSLLLLGVELGAKPLQQTLEQDSVRLELELDQDTPGFGELVQLSLSVIAEAKILPTFPDIPETLSDDILVLERAASGPFALDEQHTLWRRTYTLLPQNLGEQTIPALTVHWQPLPNGCPPQCPATQTATFQTVSVNVTSVLEEGIELNQLQATSAPLSLTPALKQDRSVWPWLIAGGAVLLIGTVWLTLRKRVAPATDEPSADPLSEALTALDTLRQEGLLTPEQNRRFHKRISKILRQYLNASRTVPALQRTRQEIYQALSHRNDAEPINRILAQCDAVLFARSEYSAESMQKVFDQTKTYLAASRDGTS